jgi:two-component system chemotaxis response regulator CheB
VIGASTGGTEAIRDVLTQMPQDVPPILVAQHMPDGFTRTFAARLDTLCSIRVKEAEDGELMLAGHAYIAPGHSHLIVARRAARYLARLSQSELVNRHRPSVDVLFTSAARTGASNVVGVLLTGMGRDGAAGLLELRQAGGYTYAQDEQSCVVFGMPKEAIALGAVDEVLPVAEIGAAVVARLARQDLCGASGSSSTRGPRPLTVDQSRADHDHERKPQHRR